jgi:thiol:disulfide interchange protein DsbD
MKWIAIIVAAIATAGWQLSAARAQSVAATNPGARPGALVTARMVCDRAAVAPGETMRVGVLLTIAPGWHVYWRNSGDAGLATSVTWRLDKGWSPGELRWPLPERFADSAGQVTTFGYAQEVLLWAPLKVADSVTAGQKATVAMKVQWLVCDKDRCVPGQAELTEALPITGEDRADNGELFARWEARLPVDATGPESPVDATTGGAMADDSGVLTLSVHWKKPRGDTAVEVFPVAGAQVEASEAHAPAPGTADTDGWTMRVHVLRGEGPVPMVLPIVLVYQDSAGVRRGVTVNLPLGKKDKSTDRQP